MKRTISITIIFAICVLTLSLTFSWREIIDHERKGFDYESNQIVTLLSEHFNQVYNLSVNFQSFFHASDYIDVDEFRIFAEDALANYPTVKTAAYSPRVKADRLNKFIEEKRYWGIINYDVYSLDNMNKQVKLENKKQYYPIEYCEPYIPENVRYLGCDINSLDNIKTTFQKALKSGKPEHYFGSRLIFEDPGDFMICIPVYEGKYWPQTEEERINNNNGMIILIVNSGKLIEKVLLSNSISISLMPDINNIEGNISPILNINAEKITNTVGNVKLASEYKISIYNQKYVINISKNINMSDLRSWPLVLAVAISLALTASVYYILKNRFELAQELNLRTKTQDELIRHKKHLEVIVEERTRELSDKNLILEKEIHIRENAEIELKNTTSQLIQTEKLATIGQIAAGVAHEVNTPLGAIGSTNSTMQKVFEELINNLSEENDIFTSSDLITGLINRIYSTNNNLSSREIRSLKKQISEKLNYKNINKPELVTSFLTNTGIVTDYEEFLPLFQSRNSDKILNFIQRIATIINGTRIIDSAVHQSSRVVLALKDYARSEQFQEMTETNIQETIDTALLLWKNKIKHGIELVTHFDAVPPVLCHSHELCQVWTNLIQNAIQAMNNNGRLTISLKQIKDTVQVKIADTGPGIPPSIQDKIFEPLFTTKGKGEGTGLGLDISKRIIERHHGSISLISDNKGTIFTVTLPISYTSNINNETSNKESENIVEFNI